MAGIACAGNGRVVHSCGRPARGHVAVVACGRCGDVGHGFARRHDTVMACSAPAEGLGEVPEAGYGPVMVGVALVAVGPGGYVARRLRGGVYEGALRMALHAP